MADIDQIIAGGAGASSRADFSGLSNIAKSYWQGRDEFAKNDLRDAFKGGLPMKDGQPDWGEISNTLMQKGALDQGIAASNVDLQRQGIQQNREGANFVATGGAPPQQPSIVSPPSTGRGASVQVLPALAKGGAAPQGQASQGSPQGPQGDQPGSIVGLVSSAGIPDELAGPVIKQVSALIKTDPNATLDPQLSQRVQQVVQAAAQRMKAGQPQPPMGLQPQQPQVQPPAPSPFANAVAAGLIPPNVDPDRYVAGLKYRAAALPKGPAQELMQSQVNAIDKASELTAGQRDYSAAQRNPKLDDYVAQQEAAKASAKGVAEADIKEQNDLIGQGKQASNRLTTLNTLSNIISSDQNITLGFGGPTALKVKMALESLGVPVPDLSGAQAIQKLNASLASEMAKSLTSRTTQFEFKTFLGNNPGLELDKSGNERLIGIFSQLAKRDVDLGKLARQNRDNWNNWDQVVENYDKKNPMRDPVTKKVLSTDSVVAPGPSKGALPAGSAISSKADYDKLQSGATFTGPDGKPWRKP